MQKLKGRIIRGIAGFYYVESGGFVFACKARGLFRKDGLKPLPGDICMFTPPENDESEGNVTEILERNNVLIRPAVSNVDQAVLVHSIRSPEPRLYLIDEYLILMEQQGIPAMIVWNKADLDDGKRLEAYTDIYRRAGYEVLSVSAKTGDGVPELLERLKGKTTVLAGPSGVGKSTLTNLLCPGASMETGEISRRISRGKQTTRHTELFPLGNDSYLLDTPGFTSLYVEEEPDALRMHFPEFRESEGKCRFTGCRHLKEPDCDLKDRVKRREVPESRYESYKKLMEELMGRKRYG